MFPTDIRHIQAQHYGFIGTSSSVRRKEISCTITLIVENQLSRLKVIFIVKKKMKVTNPQRSTLRVTNKNEREHRHRSKKRRHKNDKNISNLNSPNEVFTSYGRNYINIRIYAETVPFRSYCKRETLKSFVFVTRVFFGRFFFLTKGRE